MNKSDNNMGMTNPPLRVKKIRNVCTPCASFWASKHVQVPTNLPSDNAFCPARTLDRGGLNKCLKVDWDYIPVERKESWELDLALIETYPIGMEVCNFKHTNIDRTSTRNPVHGLVDGAEQTSCLVCPACGK